VITLESGDFGWDYLIRDEDTGKDILIQTDYDYPGVASAFGWSPGKVPQAHCHLTRTKSTPIAMGAPIPAHKTSSATIVASTTRRTARSIAIAACQR
jgi:hypothetical protein